MLAKKYLFLPFLFISTALFLSGCATTQKPHIKPPTEKKTITSLETWSFRGKLGVKHAQEGVNASLFWEQDKEEYHIRLTGPLGQGGLEITGNTNRVVVIDQKGHQVETNSVETFLHQRLGWALPVKSLPYWIKGIPAPSSTFKADYFDNKTLKTLSQQGWEINYLEYMGTSKGLLPNRFALHRQDTHLRVVIKTWKVD